MFECPESKCCSPCVKVPDARNMNTSHYKYQVSLPRDLALFLSALPHRLIHYVPNLLPRQESTPATLEMDLEKQRTGEGQFAKGTELIWAVKSFSLDDVIFSWRLWKQSKYDVAVSDSKWCCTSCWVHKVQ